MQEHRAEMLAEEHWRDTLDFLTADMDPQEVDIKVLADRYREYIDELQEFDLEVPAKAIRICAALLKIKTYALDSEPTQYIEEEDHMQEDPMAFEDDEEDRGRNPDLNTGPELEIPVKPKPKRRMELSELKDALEDAMQVKEKRQERQEQREMMDHDFQTEEDTIREKMNSLYSKVRNMVSGEEKVEFNSLLENQTSEEKIEKFMHVLTLENDKKVTCIQEEFLGDLHVKPEEEEAA